MDRHVVRIGAAAGVCASLLGYAACAGPADPSTTSTTSTSEPRTNSTDASRTSTAPTPDAGTPSSNAPAADDTITVVAGGDVLLHEPTWYQADADDGAPDDGTYDFTPQIESIRPLVEGADLALCHLETPLAPEGGPYSGYPTFSGPPEIATALHNVGFDACSQVSNHTFDKGLAGVERTADELAAAGITPYGATIGDHPGNPTLVQVPTASGDVPVGLLNYAYGFNGAVPAGGSAVAHVVDPALVAHDAAAARAAGAQIVIASVHWGTEYEHDPNAMQLALAPKLAAIDDLDLVIGHHAHVVEPFAVIDGLWVTYGLGNMLAAHATEIPDNQEGVLADFTFTPKAGAPGRWEITTAAYQPIFVDRTDGVRLVEVPQAEATASSDAVRERYAVAEKRTRGVVESLDAPVVEITAH